MTERFCDCTKCPCNVPIEHPQPYRRLCDDCLAEDHMDRETAQRSGTSEPSGQPQEATE